ncbi:probable cytokinin riboside 5'-monophosphate phosphoribohydrolase LOGL10 [Populus trichocarpa]|uniref:probable cytokinin riboside 5'-monophosphate phosphoribohydrolase LOGL10 n=1 Tax=Populus trichocarpa TaxID=3694 RepID=UPI0022797182|nr:probable cytokinin riboside 5'-monophosphate phosphoribohydrolase LOGL10 [Populus trichocarpa]
MASSSVPKIKNICVFCGSNPGKEKEFLESANHLGRVLAERKIHLVYGGGSLGLMGSVSIAAFLGGSQVLGVIPKALAEWDIIGKTVGEELQVSAMSERLSVMFNHADAFIALPGGLGTLEEIFHISSWAQLNIHQKPIGLLNVNGFYNTLLSFLDHAVEQQFLTFSARQILISAATAEQLIDELQSFIPVIDSSMSRLNWSITERRKKLRLDLSLSL